MAILIFILMILTGIKVIQLKEVSMWHMVGVVFLGIFWIYLILCDVFPKKKDEPQLLEG